MQRILTGLTVIPGLLLLVGMAGCGKEDKPKPRPPVQFGGDKTDGGGATAKNTIKPGTAKVVGRVVLDGAAPTPGTLEDAMKQHKDQAHCLLGSAAEKMEQTWIPGKDGGVPNVVIWVNPPEGSEFEVVKASGNAVLDQPHCVYVPHVLAVKPGEKLVVKNSAAVAHNTKLDVDTFVNKPFSQTIPPKQEANPVELNPQDKAITAVCDFHGWMRAKIWVSPHQYVAVTKDDGSFVIENVPEGDFQIVAWHEGPGFFHGGKKGTKTTIKGGENKLPDIKAPTK